MNPSRVPLWLAIALSLLFMYGWQHVVVSHRQPAREPYSEFLSQVKAGRIAKVIVQDRHVRGVRADGTTFRTYNPNDPGMVDDLLKNGVAIEARPPEEPGLLAQILISWFPMLLLIGVWVWMLRRSTGGAGGGIFSFGRSRARRISPEEARVTLADVAGVDEARDEVGEIVEFLRDPAKFQKIGGRIPRGVLMVGPPGTGKTLLARAIAGEAKVPFFTISGSDFVEMFVGVGASRVRDMFEQAKQQAPCIIFIDEIDAVGRRRGAGLGGGHDEREQTLNQLLVEMDGFEGTEGVIIIAATNRPDVLDPALLRPGRFDRQVVVPLPDIAGREEILRLHMRKVPLAPDVDARVVARGTPGFSGADLANLVNEAALFAARADERLVRAEHFERAKDKLLMGTERRSAVMSEEVKRLTAYHEAGHTIVGRLVPSHDPVHKVSIVPRGRALGLTVFLPEQDRYSLTREQVYSRITSVLGGRVAEELIFGTQGVTTGAANDLEQATRLARNMVMRWGLSEQLGPLAYDDEEGEVFLGRAVTQHSGVSDRTYRVIDTEVRRIMDTCYERARTILMEKMDRLHAMAEALVRFETLDAHQIDDIMAGASPREPGTDHGPGGSGGGTPTPVPGGGAVPGRPAGQPSG